jgi:hypothetical protein
MEGIGISPISLIRASCEKRNVMTIVALLTLRLMLHPAIVLANQHRNSEHRRSDVTASSLEDRRATIVPLILPPPNEPSPPPPPGEDLLRHYSSADLVNSRPPVNLSTFNGEGEGANRVLELPRSLVFRRRRLLVANYDHRPGRRARYDKRLHEYAEKDANQTGTQDDEPGMDYDPDLQLPPGTDYDPEVQLPPGMDYDPHVQLPSTTRGPVGVTGSHGGFIPLNPRGITVLPGERSSIPPTSPLLTTPPGSAAMPYVWRP